MILRHECVAKLGAKTTVPSGEGETSGCYMSFFIFEILGRQSLSELVHAEGPNLLIQKTALQAKERSIGSNRLLECAQKEIALTKRSVGRGIALEVIHTHPSDACLAYPFDLAINTYFIFE